MAPASAAAAETSSTSATAGVGWDPFKTKPWQSIEAATADQLPSKPMMPRAQVAGEKTRLKKAPTKKRHNKRRPSLTEQLAIDDALVKEKENAAGESQSQETDNAEVRPPKSYVPPASLSPSLTSPSLRSSPRLQSEAGAAVLEAPGGATEPELDEPEQPAADADEREEAELEEPEEAAGEESDVDDAASMSQYSNPNDIPDEQILNPQGYEDYHDALYRSELPCQAPDYRPFPSKLTGFAADLSDAEDGRDDDLEPYPKKWKKANSRK